MRLLMVCGYSCVFAESLFDRYSLLRLGFMGNHPFCTRFFCLKSSPMPHRADAPETPHTAESMVLGMNSAPVIQPKPTSRKTAQGRVPQRYSTFITMGCQKPMVAKVARAIIIPLKYMSQIWELLCKLLVYIVLFGVCAIVFLCKFTFFLSKKG